MELLKNYLDRIYPIGDSDWKSFKDLFVTKKLAKGDFFIKEGQRALDMAFLKDGVIRVFYTNLAGKEYTKRFFTPPSIIGSYSSLITQTSSIYSQQAITDCTLYVANYANIEKMFDSHQNIERLGRRYAEVSFVLNERKELEMALCDAFERYRIFRGEFSYLEEIVPQYHIASYLNISPTQLSRIRKKMGLNQPM